MRGFFFNFTLAGLILAQAPTTALAKVHDNDTKVTGAPCLSELEAMFNFVPEAGQSFKRIYQLIEEPLTAFHEKESKLFMFLTSPPPDDHSPVDSFLALFRALPKDQRFEAYKVLRVVTTSNVKVRMALEPFESELFLLAMAGPRARWLLTDTAMPFERREILIRKLLLLDPQQAAVIVSNLADSERKKLIQAWIDDVELRPLLQKHARHFAKLFESNDQAYRTFVMGENIAPKEVSFELRKLSDESVPTFDKLVDPFSRPNSVLEYSTHIHKLEIRINQKGLIEKATAYNLEGSQNGLSGGLDLVGKRLMHEPVFTPEGVMIFAVRDNSGSRLVVYDPNLKMIQNIQVSTSEVLDVALMQDSTLWMRFGDKLIKLAFAEKAGPYRIVSELEMAAGESVAYLPGDVIVIARKAKNGRASTLSWGRVVPRQRASIRSDFQVFRESSLAALDRLQMPEHFFVLPRDVGDGETVIVVHDVGVMAFRFEQQVAMLPIEDLKKARAIGDGRVLIESESQGTLLIDYSRQSNFGTQEWSQLYTTQPLKAEKLIKHSGTN